MMWPVRRLGKADDVDSGAELMAGRTRVSIEDIFKTDYAFSFTSSEQLVPRHSFTDAYLTNNLQ